MRDELYQRPAGQRSAHRGQPGRPQEVPGQSRPLQVRRAAQRQGLRGVRVHLQEGGEERRACEPVSARGVHPLGRGRLASVRRHHLHEAPWEDPGAFSLLHGRPEEGLGEREV